MSVVTTQSVLSSAPPISSGYFGEPGVYYDTDDQPGGSVDDPSAPGSTSPTLKPPKNPSLKLLWLIVSSMVAVHEGNCHFCPAHNGLYPNVGNCKCYFKCIDGVPIQKWCPPGQKFDVMSMTCSFPSKTVCAGSLVHMLPSIIANYQKQGGGGNNNMMPQMPQQQMIQHQGNKGNFHVTVALAKPNYNGGGNGGNGGDMQMQGENGMQIKGNMMQMMQMMMMMMQNQQQGMNGNGNQQNGKYQNMMMNNYNMMNQSMDQQNMMNQDMMNQDMMNQNMMNQNMMNQNMMNQNMMKQNMMKQNMMNQNMMNQNMMNQNMMNQDMMNQNMMNQNMNQQNGNYQNMNQQNMNQNIMQQGGGQQPQCMGPCHKPKKQITIVYDLNFNKFPIRFKLFG